MTSGQDVSEFLDILGLVKSYFQVFWRKKIENFFLVVLRTPQRFWRFDCVAGLLANPDMALSLTQDAVTLSHVTGLWARPVIRHRPVTGPDRITTSPARTGTGEPLHRLEPVPVRGFTGTGSPVGRFSK
jgi:hypothetical protein